MGVPGVIPDCSEHFRMTVTCSRGWCSRGYRMRCRDWKTLRKSEVQSGHCGNGEGVLNLLNATAIVVIPSSCTDSECRNSVN